MTMRKLLAVVLCMLTVMSVVALAARAGGASEGDAPLPSEQSTNPTTVPTTKPLGDRIAEGWEKIKPYFDWIYKFSFQGISQALVAAFQWLLSLVGLNFWQGGMFGFLS